MKKEVFLLSTALSLFTCGQVWAAACATPPDCVSLGYTMSAADCAGSNAIKCPSDPSKVWCDKPAETGLRVGDILYSDKTTSPVLVTGKTPIGVVIDVTQRIAVSLEEKNTVWAVKNTYCANKKVEATDDSWSRTKALYDVCAENAPAAAFCYTYKTAGTKEGDWALPSKSDAARIIKSCNERLRSITCRTINDDNTRCYEVIPKPYGWGENIPQSCNGYTNCTPHSCSRVNLSTCKETENNSGEKACHYLVKDSLHKLNKPIIDIIWFSSEPMLYSDTEKAPYGSLFSDDILKNNDAYKTLSYPVRCITHF